MYPPNPWNLGISWLKQGSTLCWKEEGDVEVEEDEWMTISMALRGALHISSHIISCPVPVAHLVRAPS